MPGYSIETYQRADGWWSFRVNGRESHYRSSNEAGLQRTIGWLLQGRKPGAVAVPAVRAGGRAMGDSEPAGAAVHWADLPTTAGRVAAFLARGKLGGQGEG